MSLIVKLGFDPFQCGCADTAAVFQDEIARTLYLLWRRGHIVNGTFPKEVLAIAARIKAIHPETAKELSGCFSDMPGTQLLSAFMTPNFIPRDVKRFCPSALPYFTGEESIDYEIKMEPSAT